MPMTAAQLRASLKRLKLSQMELSRRLKVAPTTVRRWVAGTSPIPEAVALLLEEWSKK
jgi:DNA-binding transcriptional regulator YiaG